jgi:hypothetical protein
MLTELWELKNEVNCILQKEYDDHCKFKLTDHPYRGIYSHFSWWNANNKLENQQGGESPFTSYLVTDNVDVDCYGWGCTTEESIINLIKATYKLTQNQQIEVIYNKAAHLIIEN